MTFLVTGSSGHLGEALCRTLKAQGRGYASADIKPGPYTTHQGDLADPDFTTRIMKGVSGVLHAATLHKPHVVTHSFQQFVDANVTGTLNLLEAAAREGVESFIFTSTTSTFGEAMRPSKGSPAVLVTEDLAPIPKNIYGVTKLAAENLCRLVHKKHKLPCLVLRTSRFFPEEDDSAAIRNGYDDLNAKVNELLYRRADIEDIVSAHMLALDRAPEIGFARYIISATTPFRADDLEELGRDAPAVLKRYVDYEADYARRGWRMFDTLDRLYVNDLARKELGWKPKTDFSAALDRMKRGESPFSALAGAIGKKGYHDEVFENGPFPVDE
ncbi:NAD-dependent epimerase/dehydratase family protein [Hyphococcus luteus]|uniref:NAD-dependent epimerase n=1 Tax=Hyphococcus luteus TaxID=2058213 RepID=A0A2S7K394_9PROT|nr:NAD(P)-dependent oxidoreductase [Marinicaulis flavus]PQA86973.1 NAD-dependent epimerase [Marinicaulis flavus]